MPPDGCQTHPSFPVHPLSTPAGRCFFFMIPSGQYNPIRTGCRGNGQKFPSGEIQYLPRKKRQASRGRENQDPAKGLLPPPPNAASFPAPAFVVEEGVVICRKFRQIAGAGHCRKCRNGGGGETSAIKKMPGPVTPVLVHRRPGRENLPPAFNHGFLNQWPPC